MAYLISFDKETGLFSAQSRSYPKITGRGESLDLAIDDLEASINQNVLRSDTFDLNLMIQEKKSRIELLAKVSINV